MKFFKLILCSATISGYSNIISTFILRYIPTCRKFVASNTMCFFKIYSRGAKTIAGRVFGNSNHSQMVWVTARSIFTNVVDVFTTFILPVNNHRKLMHAYQFPIVASSAVTSFIFCRNPVPTFIFRYNYIFYNLNQVIIKISNIFELSLHSGTLLTENR